jgi:endonuclease-8
MPEGPEIRRAADGIARALSGRTVERVFFAFENLKPWEARLGGMTLSAVDTIGKHMLCRFEDGTRIHTHNQLYGRWWVKPLGRRPVTGRQLRLALHGADRSALLYSASEIEVLLPEELGRHPRLSALGPDPLHDDVGPAAVAERLLDARFRRRRLSGLLLDQRFMAGLGNYLRSEILFTARLAPSTRPVDCADEHIVRLAEAILTITRRSYRTGGVTNSPTVARRLRAAGVARPGYRFAVFSRAGQPCHRCGGRLRGGRAGGRRIYDCPACQPRPGV